MRNKILFIFLGYLVILFCFIISSCQHDIIIPADYGYKGPCNCPGDSIPIIKEKPCSTDTVYFRNTILPLIQSSCGRPPYGSVQCHDINAGGEQQPLVSYQNIRQIVVAGSANSSTLYDKITKTDPQDRMPPAPLSALTPEQINLIKKWIEQGAKDNACNSCDTTAFKFSTTISLIIRDNCKGCHSGSSPSKGVSLTSYAEIHAIVLDGRLKNVLNVLNGYKQMPPAGKLLPCRIVQINKWIANGAPND
jgi:mono/diheme cytochrome c family protein